MATWQWVVYLPPEKGLPFLVVLLSGARTKKVEFAIPAKTAAEAEALLKAKFDEGISNKHPAVAALERREKKRTARPKGAKFPALRKARH